MVAKMVLMILVILFIGQTQPSSDYTDSSWVLTPSDLITNASHSPTQIDKPGVSISDVNKIVKQLLLEHSCEHTRALQERSRIDSLFLYSMNMEHDYATKCDIILEAKDDLKKWRKKYSYQANVESSRKINKYSGTIQILSGVTGLVLTIIDATVEKELKYSYQEPILGTRGRVVGSKEVSSSLNIKPKWVLGHTIMSVLSSGLLISGIISVSF